MNTNTEQQKEMYATNKRGSTQSSCGCRRDKVDTDIIATAVTKERRRRGGG